MARLIRSEPDVSQSLDELRTRIGEAQEWCSRAPTGTPHTATLRQLPSPAETYGLLQMEPRDLVRELLWVRARRTLRSASAIALPRFLVYFPSDDTCDGSASAVTDGLLDTWSTPPWDTWVGWFVDELKGRDGGRGYLLAIVPNRFVIIVQSAIDASSTESIVWLEDSGTALAHLLQGP
jgi:hypothetical protein